MGAKLLLILGFLALRMASAAPALAAFITAPRIDEPQQNQAVQGVVRIIGSTNINGFQSAEVAFSFSGRAAAESDWFLVSSSADMVVEGTLAVWDTSTLADGDYDLRVKVTLQDGRTRETIISGIRVRNYTPIETNTPQPIQAAGQQPSQAPAAIDQPERPGPSPLPANPLELTPAGLNRSLLTGAGAGVGVLLLIGAYVILRNRVR